MKTPNLIVAVLAAAFGGCDSAPQDAGNAPAAAPATTPAATKIEDGLVEQLAARSDPHTLYTIGNDYAVGERVEEDQDIAERLWKVACDKGHAYACSNYGSRQIEHANLDAAATYLTLAAEAGVLPAIRNLIELHDNPNWRGASAEESVKWFNAMQALESTEPAQSAVDDEP